MTELLRLTRPNFSAVMDDGYKWTLESGSLEFLNVIQGLVDSHERPWTHGGDPDFYGLYTIEKFLLGYIPEATIEILFEYPPSIPGTVY